MRAPGTRGNSIADPNNPTIIVDPPSGLPVTTAAIFSGPTTCWEPIIATNPGKQSGAVGTPVNLPIVATDASPGETLSYSAGGLPAGLAINPASGQISGTPTARGRKHVTITVSDSVDSATVTFVWSVSRH